VKIRSELKAKGISNALIQDNVNENAAIWFPNMQKNTAQVQLKITLHGLSERDFYKAGALLWNKFTV